MRCLSAVTLLMAAGCASTTMKQQSVGMPNPASVYCKEQGGMLEMRSSPEGQTGYCHLPDGRVTEEWELYRSQRGDGAAGT